MAKHVSRAIAVAISVLICMLIVVTNVPSASAWSGTAYHDPMSAYAGQSVTFDFELKNTGSSSMDVRSAELVISWGSLETRKALTGVSSLAPGTRGTLSATFTVPQVSPGSYVAVISIDGKAVGDLWADTRSWTSTFTVIEIEPLTVNIHADTTSGDAPLYTRFSATVSGGVGPYYYDWTLGDGERVRSPSFSHEYMDGGSYTATLVVTDSYGRTARDSVNINVQDGPLNLGDIGQSLGGLLIIAALVVVGIIAAAIVVKRKKARPPQ